jgi:hypothetical protein
LDTHVKVLAWLYIVFGVLGSLFGLGMMALLGVIGRQHKSGTANFGTSEFFYLGTET